MDLGAPLVSLGGAVLIVVALIVVVLVCRSRAARASVSSRVDLVGEQPAAESWLREALDAATETKTGRWSYDIYPLGLPGGRYELRAEVASPQRDALITVRLDAPAAAGLFTPEDPVRVQVGTEHAPPAPAALGWLAGPFFTEADGVRRRLVRRIRAQNKPSVASVPIGAAVGADPTLATQGSSRGTDTPANVAPARPTGGAAASVGSQTASGPALAHFSGPDAPGVPTSAGAASPVRPASGAFAPRRRRPRRRLGRAVTATVVVLLVTVLGTLWYTGRLDGVFGGGATPAATKAKPTRPPVVSGTKPKSAKACKASGSSKATPRHSAVGNAKTTCAFAESVRKAYIDKGKPGQSGVKLKAYDRSIKKDRAVTCSGAHTVKCSGQAKLVYLY